MPRQIFPTIILNWPFLQWKHKRVTKVHAAAIKRMEKRKKKKKKPSKKKKNYTFPPSFFRQIVKEKFFPSPLHSRQLFSHLSAYSRSAEKKEQRLSAITWFTRHS